MHAPPPRGRACPHRPFGTIKTVDRYGKPNPRGRFVRGTNWYHDGGPFLPDGGLDVPETMVYPRRFILKVEFAR